MIDFEARNNKLKINSDNSMKLKSNSTIISSKELNKVKEFSFGEEMINQGIETIEFVLGIIVNSRLCIQHCFIFKIMGIVISS